jgi:hypothetical protein
MAPKKEQVFGGIDGIICISAIILAIVFGILWGEQRDKRKSCGDDLTKCRDKLTTIKNDIPTDICSASCSYQTASMTAICDAFPDNDYCKTFKYQPYYNNCLDENKCTTS